MTSWRFRAVEVLAIACALGGSVATASAAQAASPASAWSASGRVRLSSAASFSSAATLAPGAFDRRMSRRTGRAGALLGAASTRPLVTPLAAGAAGAISGKVTAAKTGEPLAGVEVCAFGESEPIFGGCATTNSAGEYTITEVTPGSYEVEFFLPSESQLNYATQYYDGANSEAQATPVPVAPGADTAGIDAALVAGGTIAGKVTNAQSQPLEGIEVCALDQSGEFAERCTTTAANGEYSLTGVAAGERVVEFAAGFESELNYAPQYYDDETLLTQAKAVPVAAESTTEHIDATLSPGGEIAGRVVSLVTGAPIGGILVCAEQISPAHSSRCSGTDSNGEYELASLAGASYEVVFLGGFEYAAQFYREAASPAGAVQVQVTQGAVTANIDAALMPSVPEGISAPKVSGAAVAGQRLTLTHGLWTGVPTGYLDEWGACAGSGEIATCRTFATGESAVLGAAEVGHTIRVREYASNVSGRSELPSYSAATALVAAAPAAPVTPPANAPAGAGGVAATHASAPSKRQLEALLLRALTPSGKNAKIAALLRNRGYRVSLAALAPGRVTFSWFAVPRAKHVKRVLVASGRLSFAHAGTVQLTIKLTAGGRALLQRSGRVRLTASGTLVTSGASTVALTKGFLARR